MADSQSDQKSPEVKKPGVDDVESFLGRETFRGIGHQWFCDDQGHVNSRYIVGMLDDATSHALLLTNLSPDNENGWVDVRNEIDYRREVVPGAHLVVRTIVEKIGSSSITFFHQMTDVIRDIAVAEMRAKIVQFDLSASKSVQLSQKQKDDIARSGLLLPSSDRAVD